jgi:hypothetical protein
VCATKVVGNAIIARIELGSFGKRITRCGLVTGQRGFLTCSGESSSFHIVAPSIARSRRWRDLAARSGSGRYRPLGLERLRTEHWRAHHHAKQDAAELSEP